MEILNNHVGEIAMRKFSHQLNMIKWLLASLIFDAIWPLNNKLQTNEIPTRKFSHQPKMNKWVFHQTVKNKFYTDENIISKSITNLLVD
jgi:hypothetical protein